MLYNDAVEVMKIMARFKHKTSILDDFGFYDRRAQKLKERKEKPAAATAAGATSTSTTASEAEPAAPAAKPARSKGRGGKRS